MSGLRWSFGKYQRRSPFQQSCVFLICSITYTEFQSGYSPTNFSNGLYILNSGTKTSSQIYFCTYLPNIELSDWLLEVCSYLVHHVFANWSCVYEMACLWFWCQYSMPSKLRDVILLTKRRTILCILYVAISLVFSLKFCNITTLALRCQNIATISLNILATFWQRSASVVIMLQNFNVIKWLLKTPFQQNTPSKRLLKDSM